MANHEREPAVFKCNRRKTIAEFLLPKANTVHQRMLKTKSPGDIRHTIQIALRVRLLQIDRRRHNTVPHRQQRGRNRRRPARPLRMRFSSTVA